MKVISARTSFDPTPTKTGNPDPESFAPRAKSSIPSCSPISQCGLPPFGAGSPHVRTLLLSDGSPRRASAARTCWGEARRSLRSITPLLLRESELETAVAAVLVDEDLEVQPPRRGVHGQHVQLGIERERHAERA